MGSDVDMAGRTVSAAASAVPATVVGAAAEAAAEPWVVAVGRAAVQAEGEAAAEAVLPVSGTVAAKAAGKAVAGARVEAAAPMCGSDGGAEWR